MLHLCSCSAVSLPTQLLVEPTFQWWLTAVNPQESSQVILPGMLFSSHAALASCRAAPSPLCPSAQARANSPASTISFCGSTETSRAGSAPFGVPATALPRAKQGEELASEEEASTPLTPNAQQANMQSGSSCLCNIKAAFFALFGVFWWQHLCGLLAKGSLPLTSACSLRHLLRANLGAGLPWPHS